MLVFRRHESVPLYLQKLLCTSPIMFVWKNKLDVRKLKSVFHGYIGALTSSPSCSFEMKSWFLNAIATDTRI